MNKSLKIPVFMHLYNGKGRGGGAGYKQVHKEIEYINGGFKFNQGMAILINISDMRLI